MSALNSRFDFKPAGILLSCAAALARHLPPALWRVATSRPPASVHVPLDFFGINVASSEDPAADDFVIEQVRGLGIRHVRLDLTYGFFGSFVERFARRLVREGFDIMLHLVQPPSEARLMSAAAAQERWRIFVNSIVTLFADSIGAIEVGSTPNRSRWAGYTIRGYLAAFAIAAEIAREYRVKIAGPNITDFEPLYNIMYLSLLRRTGYSPDIHTDNLFVERVIEPEISDYRVAGTLAARLVRLDLVGKANALKCISRQFGIPKTFCSHVSWSSRRIARFQIDTEEKQADYLTRYLLLAAASGALDRVYWGPLVGDREGLIGDGTSEYPDIPRVVLYDHLSGSLTNYRRRAGYAALASLTRLLGDSQIDGLLSDRGGPDICRIKCSNGDLADAIWMRDRGMADLHEFYSSNALGAARIIDRSGREVTAVPPVSEQPLFLIWHGAVERTPILTAGKDPEHLRIAVPSLRNVTFAFRNDSAWKGIVTLAPGDLADERARVLSPSALEAAPVATVLRDARNRVWVIRDSQTAALYAVKRSSFPACQRSLRFASKAALGWSNSCEMLRRGIKTAFPRACFEPAARVPAAFSYFVCDFVTNAWSARQAFDACRAGDSEHRGFSKMDLFRQIAGFVADVHNRGMFHRDLSAGNLLMTKGASPRQLDLWLIDTARARFFHHPLGTRRRLADLMRLCHPLDWENREQLLALYFDLAGGSLTRLKRLAFLYYDLKHQLKGSLRAWRNVAKRSAVS